MSRPKKTLDAVLNGGSDANIAFKDLCGLLEYLGFDVRIRGSHRIYTRADVSTIINIQPKRNQAKPVQVKQVRNVIIRNGLALNIYNEENHGQDDETEAEQSE